MVSEKGFKQTEIGLIPEDWNVFELSEVVIFLDGQRRPIKSSERISGEFPYYGASGIIDYVNNYIFDDDLILLGEDGENILSRNLPLAFKVSGKIWVNNHAHVLKPKEGYDISFLTDYLESLDYSLLNSGTAQPKLNKQACLTIKIGCPGINEQTAIATALSDMDELIAQTVKLIAKKKAIKQGVMQELLRPKEGWKKMTLLSISSFINGKPYEGLIIEDGEYDLITLDSVSIDGKLKKSHKKININDNSLNKNDLVVVLSDLAHGKFLGKCGVIPESQKFVLNQRMGRIRVADSYNPYFVHLLINQNQSYFKDRGQGSSQKHIYKKDFASFEISVPSKHEQDWISTVAIDIENQIEIIDDKIQKLKLQKQGMMQALLTGKIRLI